MTLTEKLKTFTALRNEGVVPYIALLGADLAEHELGDCLLMPDDGYAWHGKGWILLEDKYGVMILEIEG